jgi:hypothetical protein
MHASGRVWPPRERLAVYLTIQAVLVLVTGYRPGSSVTGIAWTAATAAAMFALAAGKARTGRALGNPVLVTEGRVTLVDGILAVAVLAGLVLNAAADCGRPIRRRCSVGVLVPVGLAVLVPGGLHLGRNRVRGGSLIVELAERCEGPSAVDGGRAAVHQEGDADGLGGFLRRRAVLDGSVGVGGDAAVAFLAHRNGQGDEFLGPGVQGPGCQRRIV